MNKIQEALLLLIVIVFIFVLGNYLGREVSHKELDEKYVAMCPTKAIVHTTKGEHICYIDAVTVRKFDE